MTEDVGMESESGNIVVNGFGLAEGMVLDGYRLVRRIGEGAFGVVWLCRSELGTFVAVKFLHGTSSREVEAARRYFALAVSARTSGLVPILHGGRWEGGFYYVMPLCDGMESNGAPPDVESEQWRPRTLRALLTYRTGEASWFSSGEIRRWMIAVAQGVGYLHQTGLVHRDIKPENILFFNGEACVSDISLVREDGESMTRIGTPGFLAPLWYLESGGHPDLWGLAATLFTCLTGEPPDKMGRAIFRWPPQGEKSLSAAERLEWSRLHQVTLRATHEKPTERYRDATSFAVALENGVAMRRRGAGFGVAVAGAVAFTIGAAGVLVRSLFFGGQPSVSQSTPAMASPAPTPAPLKPQLARWQTAPAETGLTAEQEKDYMVLVLLANDYVSRKLHYSALETLDKLFALYPIARDNPLLPTMRAQALFQLDRKTEAHEELKRGIARAPDLFSLVERCQMWVELGDRQGAERELDAMIASPHPVTMHFILRARLRIEQGNFAGALADIEQSRTLSADSERQGVVDTHRNQLAGEYPEFAAYLTANGIEFGPPPQPPR